ncbi:MAG TPA: chloride channel protein [Candidatus Acidoferrales bacterium]|nr:chloride channel protein [Candidatus Acidoferrales bacterium]
MSATPGDILAPSLPDPRVSRERSRLERLWTIWRRKALTLREGQLFLLLAVIIGMFSGLVVVCFRITIEWTRFWLLGSSMQPSYLRVLLAPTLGGIGVALLVLRIFKRSRGSGVNQTKAAVFIFDGYVPFRTVIGKFVTCALAIGSGQSLGPEDPSLQMGAGIASALGRSLRLSREKQRLIAPIGAAAGLAAAFNAPISAVIFVIEEIIGTWSGGVLGAVILAAISSVVVMREFLGNAPMFRVPAIEFRSPVELIGYAVLGVISGFAALAFLKFIAYTRPRLTRLPRWTHYLQPAIAGLLIGTIGLWLPQVMGSGYPIIDQVLHDQFVWRMLLLLALFKILATGISFVSGTPGGMFAPTLFIGAMLGGAVGGFEHYVVHRPVESVAAFALVGMGTFFAGFLRVPITSVFMVLEVSGNYSIIVPAIISNMIAYFISHRYQKVPLFDFLARQDGFFLPSIEELREQNALRVEDAMRPGEGSVWREDDGGRLLQTGSASSPTASFLLWRRGNDWQIVSRDDLKRQPEGIRVGAAAPEIPSRGPLPQLYPDQHLDEALRLIGDWPLVPVVNRANTDKLEGVVSLEDILRAYRNS